MEKDLERSEIPDQIYKPTPVDYLQKAYELTVQATSEPNKWQGTTTATGAQLYFQKSEADPNAPVTPIL